MVKTLGGTRASMLSRWQWPFSGLGKEGFGFGLRGDCKRCGTRESEVASLNLMIMSGVGIR